MTTGQATTPSEHIGGGDCRPTRINFEAHCALMEPHRDNQEALKGTTMTKGKGGKRGNKEAKKPKQEKPKVSATANSLAGKPALAIGGKKPK